MAEYITGIIDLPELIGYVRELAFDGIELDAVLPNRSVSDIEFELLNIETPQIPSQLAPQFRRASARIETNREFRDARWSSYSDIGAA